MVVQLAATVLLYFIPSYTAFENVMPAVVLLLLVLLMSYLLCFLFTNATMTAATTSTMRSTAKNPPTAPPRVPGLTAATLLRVTGGEVAPSWEVVS